LPSCFKPCGVKAYRIDILGLSYSEHSFDFELGNSFFEVYGSESLNKGHFHAQVILNKKETFIEVEFNINGQASLMCDRSLELFDFPMTIRKKMVFKYGEEAQEVDEEVTIITRDQASLEVGQLMYEYILLDIPMKRLHPRFANESTQEDLTLVYSSETSPTDESDDIDPRWEKLKKLK
jgi:uncharacterized protein